MTAVRNTRDGRIVAQQVSFARSISARMKGLLGTASMEPGRGLWIEPCNSIHTFFMRYAIDAVFVAADGRVLRVFRTLRPFRVTLPVPQASAVLELAGGSLDGDGPRVGDRLELEETP